MSSSFSNEVSQTHFSESVVGIVSSHVLNIKQIHTLWCVRVRVCTHIHQYIHQCMCVCVFICGVFVYVCIPGYMDTDNTNTPIHVCVCVDLWCICVCISCIPGLNQECRHTTTLEWVLRFELQSCTRQLNIVSVCHGKGEARPRQGRGKPVNASGPAIHIY